MEKKWLKRAILSAVLGSSFLGILPSVEAAEVRILPVDRAKFWAGAKFDFDVEVKGDQQLKDVDITVNGQPAEKFFGRKLVKKDLGNGVTSYRADQVTFPKTGTYAVKVTAEDGAGKGVSAAGYTVVSEKAPKRAKNVILFVGDGMSRDALEQEIAAADVADWFTFEGQHPVTDIPAYHTMADALFAALNASEDVGLTVPAKITSYLAAGRPCLVSVSGEAARVMDEAAAGLTSPAGDVHGLYENLLALADMPPERRAALGRAGRAYYETHFRREPLLRQLEDFVLSGKKM